MGPIDIYLVRYNLFFFLFLIIEVSVIFGQRPNPLPCISFFFFSYQNHFSLLSLYAKDKSLWLCGSVVLFSVGTIIDVLYFFSQFEEKLEEINHAEPNSSIPPMMEMIENPSIETATGVSQEHGVGMQRADDVNASEDFVSGIMKIVPNIDVSFCDHHLFLL